MVLIFEISRPWQWKPGKFQSRIMTRVWWGPIAIAKLHIPLHEYGSGSFEWRQES